MQPRPECQSVVKQGNKCTRVSFVHRVLFLYRYPALYTTTTANSTPSSQSFALYSAQMRRRQEHIHTKNDSFALSLLFLSPPTENGLRRCNRRSNTFANFGARSGRAAMSAHTSTGQARALSVRLSVEQHSKIKRVISKRYSTVRCSLRSGRAFVSRWFVYIATNSCNPTALIRLIDLVEHY